MYPYETSMDDLWDHAAATRRNDWSSELIRGPVVRLLLDMAGRARRAAEHLRQVGHLPDLAPTPSELMSLVELAQQAGLPRRTMCQLLDWVEQLCHGFGDSTSDITAMSESTKLLTDRLLQFVTPTPLDLERMVHHPTT